MLNEVEDMAADHGEGSEIGEVVQPVIFFHEQSGKKQDGKASPHHYAQAVAATPDGEINRHQRKQEEGVFQPFFGQEFHPESQQQRAAQAMEQAKSGAQDPQGIRQFPCAGKYVGCRSVHHPKLHNCNNVANKYLNFLAGGALPSIC